MTGPEPRRSSEPQRTCIGCRRRADRSRLLRVVAAGTAADGSAAVVPDIAARMPGRGAWVHHDTACLDLAVRRRAFPRALRVAGPIGPASLQQLAQHLGATSTTRTAPPTDQSTESEAGQHQMGTR